MYEQLRNDGKTLHFRQLKNAHQGTLFIIPIHSHTLDVWLSENSHDKIFLIHSKILSLITSLRIPISVA